MWNKMNTQLGGSISFALFFLTNDQVLAVESDITTCVSINWWKCTSFYKTSFSCQAFSIVVAHIDFKTKLQSLIKNWMLCHALAWNWGWRCESPLIYLGLFYLFIFISHMFFLNCGHFWMKLLPLWTVGLCQCVRWACHVWGCFMVYIESTVQFQTG